MGCRGRVGALILLMPSARPVMADLAPGQGPTTRKVGRGRCRHTSWWSLRLTPSRARLAFGQGLPI